MRVDLYSCVYLLSVSSISFQNHSYTACGCVCIFVKMTASTESERCTIYSEVLYVFSLQLHAHRHFVYLRFTSHLFASKKSSVMTHIKDAKQIIHFVPKTSVIQDALASFFYILPSFLPFFLLFFIPFFFFSKNNVSFVIHWVTKNLKWFFLEIIFISVFAFAFILSLWPDLICKSQSSSHVSSILFIRFYLTPSSH